MICSCGNPDAHVIARRQTADGADVVLWENGAITGALGLALPGVRVARPRTREGRAAALALGWRIMGEVALYDAAELGALLQPGKARREIVFSWSVLATDPAGSPVERWSALPQDRWAGWCVFDFCGRDGSERGRYQIFRYVSDDTAEPTGIVFQAQADLVSFLSANHVESRIAS